MHYLYALMPIWISIRNFSQDDSDSLTLMRTHGNILVNFPRLNQMINQDLLGKPLSLAVFLYLFRFKLDTDLV